GVLPPPKIAGAADAAPAGVEFFEKKIRPVLTDRCYKCHSAQSAKLKGKLLLDSREGVLKGGENGVILVPGDPDKSRLITALRYTDSERQMPPKGPLSKAQVWAFEQWVKMGAPDPRTGAPAAVAVAAGPAYDYAEAKKFWSFQPIKDPPLPAARDGAWAATPI